MQRWWPWPILLAVLFSAGADEALAFALRGSVLGNGGSRTAGGVRVLMGTAGQAAVGVSSGTRYRLHHGFWWTAGITGVGVTESLAAPAAHPHLGMPVPNPAAESVTFSLSLPAAADVHLTIYDVLGRACRTVTGRRFAAGTHWLRLDTWSLPESIDGSGVYYARLVVDGRPSAVRSFVIIR